ncbi:MAG: hypothetical protein WBZ20_18295 [Nitrososphaeraceae archaeon]
MFIIVKNKPFEKKIAKGIAVIPTKIYPIPSGRRKGPWLHWGYNNHPRGDSLTVRYIIIRFTDKSSMEA